MQPVIEPGGQPQRNGWSQPKKTIVLASIVVIAVALYYALPVVLVVFVAQPLKIDGAAMSPTLNNGDRILVNKQFGNLKRGDIVVFYYPKDTTKSFVKRIIGLPGEKIDADANGSITINGQAIEESYLRKERNQSSRARWSIVPAEWMLLNEDAYFMLGDNRDASNDSRSYGPVKKELIYGKYFMRYWAARQ